MLEMLLAQWPSLALNLAFAVAAVLVWWGSLRWLDHVRGRFKQEGGPLSIIHRDPRAAADYYGKRLIGAAIVVGLVLSSVRL